MKRRTSIMDWVLGVVMVFGGNLSYGENVFLGGAGDSWSDGANWSEGVPMAGQDVVVEGNVVLEGETPWFSSVCVKAGKTVTLAGWDTVLRAEDVLIEGTLTHVTNCATQATGDGEWVPDARVKIQCTNLWVTSTGKIDVTGKGFGSPKELRSAGYGPGGGKGVNTSGAGSYGGQGGTHPSAGAGACYGDARIPELPGSGGGKGDQPNENSGAGGGAVWIEALGGEIRIDGSILANGEGSNHPRGSGGSGGGIYLSCKTICGEGGVVRADGGSNSNRLLCGGGGGGRIAVEYDVDAQSELSVPGIWFSALGGLVGSDSVGDVGTLYFSDSRFFTDREGEILLGGEWHAEGLPDVVERETLELNETLLRFPDPFEVRISGAVTLVGTNPKIHGLELSDSVLSCDSMTIRSCALRLHGETPEDETKLYGGWVRVTRGLALENNGWIHPWSHPEKGGGVAIQAGSMTIPVGCGVDATGKGYAGGGFKADGFGPGGGAYLNVGCGGGGYGGCGGHATETTGQTYGFAYAPRMPGSGGGGWEDVLKPGARGGGLIRLMIQGALVLDGSLLANGLSWNDSFRVGAGSGGGIFVSCGMFSGVGTLQADGGVGRAQPNASAGGGGGRIAVWTGLGVGENHDAWIGLDGARGIVGEVPASFTGTLSAVGGIGATNYAASEDGTIVFLKAPPLGTFLYLR